MRWRRSEPTIHASVANDTSRSVFLGDGIVEVSKSVVPSFTDFDTAFPHARLHLLLGVEIAIPKIVDRWLWFLHAVPKF